MPWCPNCKEEYREEIADCPMCGEKLVQELPKTDEEPEQDISPAFLTSVSDINIARMLENRLRQYGIPALIKYKGSGEYLQVYMGGSPFGVDLYVPSSVLEKAKEILEPDEELSSLPNVEEEEYTEEEGNTSTERSLKYTAEPCEESSMWEKIIRFFRGNNE